jgi:hypothetical protein
MNEPDDLGQQLSAFGRRRTAKRRGRSLCAPGGAIRVQVAVHVQLKRPRGSPRPADQIKAHARVLFRANQCRDQLRGGAWAGRTEGRKPNDH